MSTPIPLSSQKRLVRLISAQTDMQYAAEAFERFKLASDEGARYDSFLTMVVAYCRPFTKNEGIGSLLREYPRFPDFADAEMNLRHKKFRDLRNKLLGHSSIEGTKVHLLAPGAPSPMTGQKAVGYGFAVEKLVFSEEPRFVSWLHDLVVRVSERLGADIATIAKEVGSKHLKNGEALVLSTGKTFRWTR